MNEKDYSAQKKHIRTHYARFPLDLRPEVLEEFKKACADNGTTPTTRGISNYRQGRQKCRPFVIFGSWRKEECTNT